MDAPDVEVREVGPRDGLQLESPLAFGDKVELLEAIVATGVRRIEATAFVSPRAVPSLADAEKVAAELGRWPGVKWSALVPNLRGAQRAIDSGITQVEYVLSASESHNLANTGRSTAQALAGAAEVADLMHQNGGLVEVIIATAWDCPFDGPTPLQSTVELARRAVELGADELCLGDTIGTVVPGRVVDLIDEVTRIAPAVPLGGHFHNTRGTGLASAWAAVAAGVRRLDSSVGGLGGCPFAPGASGNIATEELVYLLSGSGVTTGLDLDRVLEAAGVVERLIGRIDSNLMRAGGPPVPLGPAGLR
jgi:hydroxymethylglutaryl-CoA lyase